nr:MAG: hypothetical protein [brine shrimp arlivirus 9]
MARNQKPTCSKNDRNIICRMDCPLTHYRYDPPSPTDPNYSAWLEGRLKSLKENQRIMLGSLSGDLCALSEAVIHVSNQLNVIKDQIANMSYFRGITDQQGPDLRHRAAPPQQRRQIEPSIAPMVQENYATNRSGRQPFRGSNRKYRSKSAHPRSYQGDHYWDGPAMGGPRVSSHPTANQAMATSSNYGQAGGSQLGEGSRPQTQVVASTSRSRDDRPPNQPALSTQADPSATSQQNPEDEAKWDTAWARSIELLQIQPYETDDPAQSQANPTNNQPNLAAGKVESKKLQ